MDAAFTPLGLVFAALSSVAWVGMDAIRKALTDKLDPLALSAGLALGQIPVFAVWALFEEWHLEAAYAWPGFLSAFLGTSGMLLFILAVSRAPLGAVVPCLSLTPVLSMASGWAMLGEQPSVTQWAGGAVVVVGALVQVAFGAPVGSGSAPRAGVAMMIGSAAFWSASAAADKWSLSLASPGAHGVAQGAAVFVLCVGGLLALRRLDRLSAIVTERRGLAAAVLIFVAALGLQWLAFAQVWVGVVEALKRAIGASGALVVGRLAFGELFHAPRVLAAMGMAVGAAMVVLG